MSIDSQARGMADVNSQQISQLSQFYLTNILGSSEQGDFSAATRWSKNSVNLSISNNIGTCTLTALGYKGLSRLNYPVPFIDGHYYAFIFEIKPKYSTNARVGWLESFQDYKVVAGQFNRIMSIQKYQSTYSYPIFYHNTNTGGYIVGDTFDIAWTSIIDVNEIYSGESNTKALLNYALASFLHMWMPSSSLFNLSVKDQKSLPFNALYGKKIVATGDSITYGANNNGVSHIAKIAARNNMSLTNYATSGGSLVTTSGRFDIGASMDTIISAHGGVDYLILSGGYNDSQISVANPIGTYSVTDYGGSYVTTTILGALETMLYKAVQTYPNAKIGYVVTYAITAETGWMSNRETMKNVLKKWGIPYIDITEKTHLINSSSLVMRSSIFTDNVHPNDAGYEIMADAVEAWLRTL